MIKLNENLYINPNSIIAVELRIVRNQSTLVIHTENKTFIASDFDTNTLQEILQSTNDKRQFTSI